MYDEEIDAELVCFLKSGNAGIDAKPTRAIAPLLREQTCSPFRGCP
jgi:hypothetical protein